MKKSLLTIVLIAFTAIGLTAQATFGAKAGVNFSNLDEDEMDYESKTGYNVGLFVEFELSDTFMIQPELLFSTQGARLEEGGAEFKINTTFINIPVLVKYKAAESFYIEAGPQIGFLSKAEQELTYGGETYTEDVKDDAKSTEFAFNLGISVDLMEELFLGGRYTIGLSDLNDMSDDSTEIKSSNISLFVGYRF